MPLFRTSRELAQRVDITFHKQRNRFRRWTWTTALAAGLACLTWLAVATLRGTEDIYEPGPLSTPHLMLSNNCVKCHNKWAAWDRLTSLSDSVRSVPNEKCIVCHAAGEHQATQIPAHEKFKCSECHGEHRGDVQLTLIPNRNCINCHSDLKDHGGSGRFARTIDSFAGSVGEAHPEFALHRKPNAADRRAPTDDSAKSPAPIICGETSGAVAAAALPKNPDAAIIRFNHKVHLAATYGPDGAALRTKNALKTADGKLLDCSSCHQLDVAGRYMLPINYEKHCGHCHPLLFDNARHPGESAPHEAPCVVRGFLTERYTLDALKRQDLQPLRPAEALEPGPLYRGLLTEESAREVEGNVKTAERRVQQHVHTLFGWEASGGCRYCHNVVDEEKTGDWAIVPPGIPDRWYPNSRFRHDSHRMLNCNACHADFSQSPQPKPVAASDKTADVLIPPIAVCLKCHTAVAQGDNLLSSGNSFTGARANCVECHTYHRRDGTLRFGNLGLDLQPIKEHSR